MSERIGRTIGPYEVVAKLGQGGMGEVYRARDSRLHRDVAIKVLPDLVAGDHDRRVRFEREAQLLASLNHPNIAQIYGLEEIEHSHLALAMELVEGETLAAIIARGAPAVTDALAIARQIVAGLEAAHEKGIIHRDLKPGNIMVDADGHVKILDFGLGKALESEASRDVSNSPTITLGATQVGMILGTAAYMSPEQAKGRAADKRSDIWSFGCVLFELLSGKRAFEGEDVSDTLAAVLKEHADLAKLPAATPKPVRLLVEKCLTRDRAERLGDISTARFLLSDGARLETDRAGSAAAPAATGWKPATAIAAIVAAIAVTALATYWLTASQAAAPVSSGVAHVSIDMPTGDEIRGGVSANFGAGDINFALSRDGRHLIYAAESGGTTKLFDRAFDRPAPTIIAGTEGAAQPFIRPDGKSVGFFAQGKLKTVSMSGGTVETIVAASDPRGGAWGDDGYIYFTNTNVSPIVRVPENGGAVTAVTKLKPEQGEISHRWPQVLPGGKGLLFSIWTGPGPDEKWIAAQPLPAGDHQVLIKGGTTGRYMPPGYLLYTRADDLFVVPMNAATLTVDKTTPVSMPLHVYAEAQEGSAMAVSESGAFAYLPGGASRLERRLVWMDDKGLVTELPVPHKAYEQVSVSPDGRTAVVQIIAGSIELWLLDLERNTFTPFVSSGSSQAPVWTPDSKRIAYRATRNGVRNLYWKGVDGGDEERLTTKPGFMHTPSSIWSNGKDPALVLFTEVGAKTGRAAWTLRLDDSHAMSALPQPNTTNNPQVSPDGKWLAVEAPGSDTIEVYLQPFPGPGARVPVSNGGGFEPRWSRDGLTLYFLAHDRLTAVDIATSPALSIGKPRSIGSTDFPASPNGVTAYSLGRDGRVLRVQSIQPPREQTSIRLVLNWTDELRKLVR